MGDDYTAGAPSTTGLVTSPAEEDVVFPDGTGPVFTSPDGTRWRLTVGDDGTPVYTNVSIVVSDTFTRANETPLSSPETGPAYTAFSGTGLSVISNQCGKVTGGTQGSVTDAGTPDAVVTFVRAAEGGSGTNLWLMRVTDANNYLAIRPLSGEFRQVVAGATTALGTLTGGEPLTDEVIVVTLDGGSVTVDRDGVEVLSVTTTLLTGGGYGFQMADTTERVDSFSVRLL